MIFKNIQLANIKLDICRDDLLILDGKEIKQRFYSAHFSKTFVFVLYISQYFLFFFYISILNIKLTLEY